MQERFIGRHVNRLGADGRQVRAVVQVEGGGRWCRRMEQRLEAEAHAIGVDTAEGERLVNGLANQGRWVLLMQLEDGDNLAHATAVRPLLAEAAQHAGVARGPVGFPALDGLGVVEGARTVGEQWQVMEGVAHVLLASITAGMAGEHRRTVEDVHVEGEGADNEAAHGAVGGHRVAVGFKHDLAVRREGRRGRDATGVGGGRERPEVWPLRSPHYADGVGLPVDTAGILVGPPVQEQGIQRVERIDRWDGHEGVAAHVADAVFDLTFFVTGVEITEMTIEEVVAAEGRKGIPFGPGATGKDGRDGGGQIVVAEPLGDAAEEGKGSDMGGEERLLALGRERHRNGTMGITKPHDAELHGHAFTRDAGLCLAPIDLGIVARLEGQRDKGRGAVPALLECADIGPQPRCAAGIPLSGQDLVDLGRRIALFARLKRLLVE